MAKNLLTLLICLLAGYSEAQCTYPFGTFDVTEPVMVLTRDNFDGILSVEVDGNTGLSYIRKRNISGDVTLTRWITASVYHTVNDCAVDALGNMYFVGYFEGSLSYHGSVFPTSSGARLFVMKTDPAGVLKWMRISAGNDSLGVSDNSDKGMRVAADLAGNCYVFGSFSNGGVADAYDLPGMGSEGTFFAKYNSATGASEWLKPIGYGYPFPIAFGDIKSSANGDLYVFSNFYGVLTLDSTVSYAPFNTSWTNVFVAKYNSSGQLLWSKVSRGSGTLVAGVLNSDDELIMTGTTTDSLAFDSSVLLSLYQKGAFLIHFDTAGVIEQFERVISTDSVTNKLTISPFGLDVDPDDNVYLTGDIQRGANFNGLACTVTNEQFYAVKFDGLLTPMWYKTFGVSATTWAVVFGISKFEQNVVVAGGYVLDNLQLFGTMLPYAADWQGFFTEICDSSIISASIVEIPSLEGKLTIYPVPADRYIHVRITDEKAGKIEMCDYSGRLLQTWINPSAELTIDLGGISPGVYLLRATGAGLHIPPVKFIKLGRSD